MGHRRERPVVFASGRSVGDERQGKGRIFRRLQYSDKASEGELVVPKYQVVPSISYTSAGRPPTNPCASDTAQR